ncbi:MAG: hypothetical protein J6Y30_07005 [Treponema sp.]|nr:hypothetical protein [Treponema sp.]
MKKHFCFITAILFITMLFGIVSCRKDSSKKNKPNQVLGTEISTNTTNGDISTGPELNYKAYENFSTSATDEQIVYVMLMNQLQYSLQAIQYYANKFVLEQEYNNIICKIDKSRLKDENGDAVAAYSNMLSTLTECKLQENKRIFIKQQFEKESSEAIYKSLSGTVLPAIASLYQVGNGVAKGQSVAHMISGAISLGYTGVSAVFNYKDAVNMLNNKFDKEFFDIEQDDLSSIDAQRNSLFKTYTRFITKYNIPKRYEIKEDQMKWLVETIATADDYSKIRLLKSKVDIFQMFTPFWYELGCSYQRVGDIKNAKSCYKVFEKQKERYSIIDNDTYYTELAKNMIQIAKEEKDTSAIKKYLAIIERDETVENESENRLYAAGVYLELNEYDEALHLLKLIIDDNKGFVEQARELHKYISAIKGCAIKNDEDFSLVLSIYYDQIKILSDEERKKLIDWKKSGLLKKQQKSLEKILDEDYLIFILPKIFEDCSVDVIRDKRFYETTLLNDFTNVYSVVKYPIKKFFDSQHNFSILLTSKDGFQITLEYECNYFGAKDIKLLNETLALLSSQEKSEVDILDINQINLARFVTDLKILNDDKRFKKFSEHDKIKILTEKYVHAMQNYLHSPYKSKKYALFSDANYAIEYGLGAVVGCGEKEGFTKYGDIGSAQKLSPLKPTSEMLTCLRELVLYPDENINDEELFNMRYEDAVSGNARAAVEMGYTYLFDYFRMSRLKAGIRLSSFPANEYTAEGIKFLKISAAQDCTDALFLLGICQYYGFGFAKDKELAIKYIRIAADAGDEDAKKFLK